MLRFVIRLTALLLGVGSVLVIVGIFDASLGWDVFSPRVESTLYGVFFSCLVLAIAGIALSFVLGVQEITELLRASQAGVTLPPPRPMRRYVGLASVAVLGVALVVVAFDRVDRRVQIHRNLVFQQLAAAKIETLASRLLVEIPTGVARPQPSVEITELVASINAIAWVERATVFLPDSKDPSRVWVYQHRWDGSSWKSRFDRMFPSKEHEHAVQRAFAGDPDALHAFNGGSAFSFLHPLAQDGSLVATVWIKANEKESLREYATAGGSGS